MREIAFDTETTGLEWHGDDRVIEVGCVEMMNHIPTGRTLRRLINPGRIEPFDAVIPFERIQTAEDGQPHICLMRHSFDDRQGFYCIFLPPNG